MMKMLIEFFMETLPARFTISPGKLDFDRPKSETTNKLKTLLLSMALVAIAAGNVRAAGSYTVVRDSNGSTVGTYTDLATAVSNCGTFTANGSYTIRVSANDTNITNGGNTPISIPADKRITITSNGGPYTLTMAGTGRHFSVGASTAHLSLNNITLDGMGSGGGILVMMSATLNIDAGTLIQNCTNTASAEGGAVNLSGGTINMTGGTLTNNTATYGGAVQIAFGTFNLSGGTITANTVTYAGGGVAVGTDAIFNMTGGSITNHTVNSGYQQAGGVRLSTPTSTFNLSGGTISGNTVGDGGGGVYVSYGTMNMSGGTITGNTANGTLGGGGIFLGQQQNSFNMTDGSITGNSAPAGRGGGIYTQDNSAADPCNATSYYKNISISGTADVSNNTSYATRVPPSNHADFTNRASMPFPGTLLDNDNINYDNSLYRIIYDANGGTGTYYVQSGYSSSMSAATLATTGIGAPTNATFVGWNTRADGNGTSYAPGNNVSVPSVGVLNLYAQWQQSYTVTVNYLDNATTPAVIKTADTYSVLSGTNFDLATHGGIPTISNYAFKQWAVGSGTPSTSTSVVVNNVTGNITINITYFSAPDVMVTVYYMNESNIALTAPLSPPATFKSYTVTQGSTFALNGTGDRIIPTISGYTFKNWKEGIVGTLMNSSTPVSLSGITSDKEVYLIYGK